MKIFLTSMINGDSTTITNENEWKAFTFGTNINFYTEGIPPAPPLPPPLPARNLKPSLSDLQGRAKTVRIGKVRWPPPLKERESFEKELAK
jgi:hypothetical protein